MGASSWPVAVFILTVQWTAVRVPGDVPVADVALVVAMGVVAVRMWMTPACRCLPPWQLWLPAVALIAGDFSPVRQNSHDLGLVMGASLIASWYVIASVRREQSWPLASVLDVLVVSAVIGSLVAVASSVTGGLLAWPGGVDYTGREVGLTSHPNQLALSCLVALTYVLFGRLGKVAAGARTRRHRGISVVFGVSLVLGVGLSGSRAGVVCAIAVGAAWGWNRRSMILEAARTAARRRRTVAALGVLVAAAPVMAAPAVVRLLGLSEFARQNVTESNALRLDFAEQAFDQISSAPWFGAGSDHLLSAHNVVLQVVVSGGIVWLVAFAPLIRESLRGAIAAVPSAPAVAVLAWLAFGMVQNPLTDRFVHLVVVVALMSAFQRCDTTEQAVDSEHRIEFVPAAVHGGGDLVVAARAGGRFELDQHQGGPEDLEVETLEHVELEASVSIETKSHCSPGKASIHASVAVTIGTS